MPIHVRELVHISDEGNETPHCSVRALHSLYTMGAHVIIIYQIAVHYGI